jgi:hypothetical protein
MRESAFMYFVDSLGFNILALNEHNQWTDFRLPFPFVVEDIPACFMALESSIEDLLAKEAS